MAMKVHSKNTHHKWNEILARHWPEHAKKQRIPEAQTLAIMAYLSEEVEPALNASFKQANTIFDMHVGEIIAERTLTCLRKIASFLEKSSV
jgi:serine/threonine-protein kinase HipA